MESIISTFHIEWQLLIAQMVNFGIVVFVLWFFVFRPLSRQMGERTKTIETSLNQAKMIAKNLEESEQQKIDLFKAARQDAQKIIQDAQKIAAEERQKTLATAKEEVKKVVEAGRARLVLEQEKIVAAIKAESADLIIAATAQVLGKVTDKKINQNLITQALEDIPAK